jgi:hypothetical protein
MTTVTTAKTASTTVASTAADADNFFAAMGMPMKIATVAGLGALGAAAGYGSAKGAAALIAMNTAEVAVAAEGTALVAGLTGAGVAAVAIAAAPIAIGSAVGLGVAYGGYRLGKRIFGGKSAEVKPEVKADATAPVASAA